MDAGSDIWADVRYTPDGTRHTYKLILSRFYFGRWGRKRSNLASVNMCTSVSSGSLAGLCAYGGSIGSGTCLVW